MAKKWDARAVRAALENKLARQFGCGAKDAGEEQIYKAVALCVKDILTERRTAFKKKVARTGAKQVYYLCMEFLLGRSLRNNLCNLGLENEWRTALEELGFSLERIYECDKNYILSLQVHR